MGFTLIAVTGTFHGPDGVPANGQVTFQLSHELSDGNGTLLSRAPKLATLDDNGHFTVSLEATDDPTTSPPGQTYQVTERIGGAPSRTYQIVVPSASPGATVDLSGIAPARPLSSMAQYVLSSTFNAAIVATEKTANKGQPSGYASLDSGGKIPLGQIPALPETDVTNLVADLAAEVSNRSAAVSAEASTRAAADSAEASTRAAADTTNANAISAETSRATAAEASEAGTRAAADTTNASAIATETTNRAAAVTAEASARGAADTSEASTRAAADTTNANAISAETTRATAAEAGKAQGFAPTAVKTSAYAAAAGDFVPVDASAGNVTITLPSAPADKTRVAVKLVAVSGSFTATVACGGSDKFNTSSGPTTGSLSLLNQSMLIQYQASTGLWYVQSTDLPLAGSDARYAPIGSAVSVVAPQTAPHAYSDANTIVATSGPNLAIGSALANISLGVAHGNTAFGFGARSGLPVTGNLGSLTTGYDNTAIGAGVLLSVTSGHGNTALGADTLGAATTAFANVAIGNQALETLTTGSNDVAVGPGALTLATTATDCIAIGDNAMATATTATTSVGIGTNALNKVVSATNNTAVGHATLANTTGSNSTAVGYAALNLQSSGSQNVAIGSGSMSLVTTGFNSAAVGMSSLASMTTGSANSALGYQAGFNVTTGTGNTCIGKDAGNTDGTTASTNNSSMTLIGELAQATTGNVIVLGKATATRPNLIFGGVGATGAFGGGVGVFAIANAVTVPASNPTGGGILYVTAGALTYRGSSGTVTTIAAA